MWNFGYLVLPFRGAATIDYMASCPLKSQNKLTKLLSVGVQVVAEFLRWQTSDSR